VLNGHKSTTIPGFCDLFLVYLATVNEIIIVASSPVLMFAKDDYTALQNDLKGGHSFGI